jgi:predicted component of type VI protein secretion system
MTSEDLRPLLAQLHERLRHAKSLDPDSRRLLSTVAADIENALATNDIASVTAPQQPLESLAVRFEADHPALAGVLRQIMDTLAKAGI